MDSETIEVLLKCLVILLKYQSSIKKDRIYIFNPLPSPVLMMRQLTDMAIKENYDSKIIIHIDSIQSSALSQGRCFIRMLNFNILTEFEHFQHSFISDKMDMGWDINQASFKPVGAIATNSGACTLFNLI